jgi:hypothetical protein
MAHRAGCPQPLHFTIRSRSSLHRLCGRLRSPPLPLREHGYSRSTRKLRKPAGSRLHSLQGHVLLILGPIRALRAESRTQCQRPRNMRRHRVLGKQARLRRTVGQQTASKLGKCGVLRFPQVGRSMFRVILCSWPLQSLHFRCIWYHLHLGHRNRCLTLY